MTGLTPEQLYAYDAQGFVRLEGFLDASGLAAARSFLEAEPDAEFPDTGLRRWEAPHRRHDAVRALVTGPAFTGAALAVINQPLRLLECYGHESAHGAFLYMHNGQTLDQVWEGGVRASRHLAYRCEYHDGRLYTTYVKIIAYLTDVGPDGGPFCYIEGSHKAQFPFPWPQAVRARRTLLSESGHPMLRTVPVRAGDVIVLNEALLHGASVRRCDGPRALLAASYGPSFMTDWRRLERAPGDVETAGYADLDDEVSFYEEANGDG